MPRRPRRGFTIASVIVLAVIGTFAAGLALPFLHVNDENAKRVQCANNLKQIGLASLLYANDNRGAYPRTRYEVADTLIPDVSNAGFDSADPFAANSKVPANCVPAAIFLLMRNEDIAAGVFVCPSTQCVPDTFGGANNSAQNRSNFTDLKANLSYSYANPYPDTAAAAAGYDLLMRKINPAFAIAADLNPGVAGGSNVLGVSTSSTLAEMQLGNSHNHGREGQNILYADGHVEWQNNPFAGVRRDNIYCRGKGGVTAPKSDIIDSPKDSTDSVLLPTEVE
ncbi:MAG: hypothetical protein ABSH22_14290 [Tepidisphaeraceae bacterium]|jgi:prepilin-type processing-associated H-X9-DG protein